MRIGCATEMFEGVGPADMAQAIRDAGLRDVEWTLPGRWRGANSAAGVDALRGDAAETAAWLKAIERCGLRVSSLRIGDRWTTDLPEVERFEHIVRRVADLGAENVVVAAGIASDGAERQRLLRRIAELAEAAADRGVCLSLDTRAGLCGDSRSMRTTLAELNHDNVRLCFDTGGYLQLNVGSSVEVALQRVLGWVGCLRLTDHNDFDDADDFPPFGLGGGVDFARILQMLDAVALTGVCFVSCRPARRRASETPDVWLRDCLTHLDECGWPFDN